MVTVGCTPLVTNYNILLSTDDKRLAAQVTRKVREKDGGLRWVSERWLRSHKLFTCLFTERLGGVALCCLLCHVHTRPLAPTFC